MTEHDRITNILRDLISTLTEENFNDHLMKFYEPGKESQELERKIHNHLSHFMIFFKEKGFMASNIKGELKPFENDYGFTKIILKTFSLGYYGY